MRLKRRLPTSNGPLGALGPGVVTGVADDDPSGVTTYTVAGAAHGYDLLWMSLVTLPLNIAVQSICARIGVMTGHGLARVIADRYGRRVLTPVVLLLFIANVVNIGADLGAIAGAINLIVPVPRTVTVVALGIMIAGIEVIVPYTRLATILKTLTFIIFAYVAAAVIAQPDWHEALRNTVIPRVALDRAELITIVAILGTTISPYLFFWQAAQEIEEELRTGVDASVSSARQLGVLARAADIDVAVGMTVANVGFYFIVLAAAATLHRAGITEVETAAEAAEVLRPLAGPWASLLFALGIIGTGLLAIPVLAGSAAYAAAELFGWREGLSRTFRQAPQFYAVIVVATALGVALVFSGVPEMRGLYWAAVLNGVIAPVLLVFVMVSAHDQRVMRGNGPGGPLLAVGWLTVALMAAAPLALLVVR